MDDLVYQNYTIRDLGVLARNILDAFPNEKVFAFFGEMGAGKTTLIKVLCEALGVKQEVTSPSFAIVNEYEANGDGLVYHFDFYRIKKLEEVLDIGYEEYLYSGYYCFLEWADIINELLPESYVYISITKGDSGHSRNILISLKKS